MGWTVKNRCMGANEACLAVTYNRFNIKLNASDSEIELIGQIVSALTRPNVTVEASTKSFCLAGTHSF